MRQSLFVALAASLVLAACGGDSPSSPNPQPSATPTPAPAATPTPTAYASCPPVRWDGQSYGKKQFAHFQDQVVQVQDRIFAAHPGLFAKDENGAPDPAHLRDNGLDTERAYYVAFVEQGAFVPALCVSNPTNDAGVPDANNIEEIWVGYAGQPLDAFRLTATTPTAPVIHKYIATNFLKGYGL
jgi:hypothetical protein